ncbi:hypothetical protein GYH30_054152 [Glycine max]|uniref:Uncharacterized protein n=1 Tax=Glycine max TaxID=3847 RepID=A0A0R0ESP1_SOYBN|nr:hypothetical protein GYH30_054152 [Glycine max]
MSPPISQSPNLKHNHLILVLCNHDKCLFQVSLFESFRNKFSARYKANRSVQKCQTNMKIDTQKYQHLCERVYIKRYLCQKSQALEDMYLLMSSKQ